MSGPLSDGGLLKCVFSGVNSIKGCEAQEMSVEYKGTTFAGNSNGTLAIAVERNRGRNRVEDLKSCCLTWWLSVVIWSGRR